MGQMIADQVLQQVVMYFISTLLSSALAAGAVGGVLWRKLHVNDVQNQRMDDLAKAIKAIEEHNQITIRHILEDECQRAVEQGCISMAKKQYLTEIWKYYDGKHFDGKHWNGSGAVAYHSIEDLPVKEDC